MLLAALLALAGAASSGTLVVLNKSDATASLIDLASGSVVATLPTGRAPHEAAVSPDGRLALASNYGTAEAPGSTLTLIDVAGAHVVKTIDLGEYRRPHGLRWLDERRVAVTCEGSQALVVVDVEEAKPAFAITTGQNVSHMVALTPDGARAFVANIGSGTVSALSLKDRKLLVQIQTGKGSEGIDVSPDGREVWVVNREEDSVSVIDPAVLRVTARLKSRSFPIRVRFTPDGKLALVSNARSGEVAVFDAQTKQELRRIAMKLAPASPEGRLFQDFGQSPTPIGIVVRPDGETAYVANSNADAIVVLDLKSWAPTGILKAGKEPDGMAFSPLKTSPAR